MNFNTIINMVLRLFMGKAINHGVNYLANRGKDPAMMTPEEQAQAKVARQNARRARQAIRIARRLGR